MVNVTLIDQGTIAGLQRIATNFRNPRPLLAAVGARANVELRAHFRAKNNTPNKLGGRRQNFWSDMASSVSGPTFISAGQVRVSVTDHRFVQKVFGGRITPKNAKALTIPVAPEAYGRTVRVFEQSTGIQLFLLRKKGGGLTNLLAGAIGGSGQKFKVYYELQPYVDQAADPTALPPSAEFNAALLTEADSALRRAINRGDATAA